MNTETRWTARRRCVGTVGSLLLAAVVLTCGTPAGAADRQYVWQRLDQFVAIEKQDGSETSPDAPNDHPARLSAEVIRATLGTLLFTSTENEKPEALFTDGELATLGETLSRGLSQARPDEDVTFALIGLHQSVLGLFKQPMVTTGRLFVSRATQSYPGDGPRAGERKGRPSPQAVRSRFTNQGIRHFLAGVGAGDPSSDRQRQAGVVDTRTG